MSYAHYSLTELYSLKNEVEARQLNLELKVNAQGTQTTAQDIALRNNEEQIFRIKQAIASALDFEDALNCG